MWKGTGKNGNNSALNTGESMLASLREFYEK